MNNVIKCIYFSFLAFFFGFVINEITYNETSNGEQEIRYSPAPGNTTERSFEFSVLILSNFISIIQSRRKTVALLQERLLFQ